jgi:hypothetical protein
MAIVLALTTFARPADVKVINDSAWFAGSGSLSRPILP